MSITVKFFASLREQLDLDTLQLDYQAQMNVDQVWHLATSRDDIPDNTLCAINMQYVDLNATVSDNDEVAFFPPVTGG